MKLGKNIRKLIWPLNKIYKGMALGEIVYLRPDIHKDLLSKEPSVENIGVLLHEQAHIERLNKSGNTLLHGIKYWICPIFRFREEIEADRARFKYLKRHTVKFDFIKRAKQLSGIQYLFCVSYKRAYRELIRVWEEV